MSAGFAAMAFDLSVLDDQNPTQAESALVRGRDGRLRPVDVARLAWPDDNDYVGVDHMADLAGTRPLIRC